MSIRSKIILIVLPLLIASVVLSGMSSYFVAASAMTRVTTELLEFKASELQKYADGQWQLLVQNGVAGREDMVVAAQAAIGAFAGSILRSPTEEIIAIDAAGKVAMRAGGGDPLDAERPALLSLVAGGASSFGRVHIGGVERVAAWFPFAPFSWSVFVTEERSVFYGAVEGILRTSLAILGASAAVAVAVLLLLAGYLTRPLEKVSAAMRRIIESNDLSSRVEIEYRDEIGQLSQNFNLMLGDLEKAHSQIRSYAFDAAVARKREFKIRNIFQLYVPKEVIDQVFVNPDSMLVGSNKEAAILFSDIRGFTSISEKLAPDDLVDSLNRYFDAMVGTIVDRGGTVDKYIGDAIMAVFGAPVPHADDALRSVLAGLEMTKRLEEFNADQLRNGKDPFKIGVGISYGVVTAGNIGCDRKMNYTVIGDEVNLASRIEGQTKHYKQPILISGAIYQRVKKDVPCRLVDYVAVKGKKLGVKIYTARSSLGDREAEAWGIHEGALERYFARDFEGAATLLSKVLALLPEDVPAALFLERSRIFARDPPPPEWDGVEVLTEK